MARSLLLVRHASIGDQYADQYVGSTDLPLSPDGCRQVEPLARWLSRRTGGRAIGRCLVSPQRRSRQTADLIAARCPGLSFQVDEDLREVDFGQWEMLTFPQIAAGFPGRIKDWSEGGDDFAFPGGERRGDFRARVARAAGRMAADPADAVLAVAHAGVIGEMIRQLLGLGPQHDLAFGIRHATAARVKLVDGRGVLTGLGLPDGAELDAR